MKKLNFSVVIQAPAARVWATMLGAETYKTWTTPFCEGSYYEGSWETGERIRFLSPGGSGMTSVIAENRPNEFLSIKHLGMVNDGKDDLDSESVRSWAPAFENYALRPVGTGTELRVDLDITPDFEQYILDTWPRALAVLKGICETRSQD